MNELVDVLVQTNWIALVLTGGFALTIGIILWNDNEARDDYKLLILGWSLSAFLTLAYGLLVFVLLVLRALGVVSDMELIDMLIQMDWILLAISGLLVLTFAIIFKRDEEVWEDYESLVMGCFVSAFFLLAYGTFIFVLKILGVV